MISAFTNVIPKGHYKRKLFEGGLVQHMAFKRSDNAATIEMKISSLFPAFFDTVDKTFTLFGCLVKTPREAVVTP